MTSSTRYDCLIVGAGASGTALLYQLARFTDLPGLCLVERHNSVGGGRSHARNNSQTIHCGDLETGYGPARVQGARRAAAMVLNYATRLQARERDRAIRRMPKMLLGVGAQECTLVRRRYQALKDLFPRMRLLARRDIADIEPQVALVDGAWRPEEIVAAGTPDDYCAADYQALAESFSFACVRLDRTTDKQVAQLFSTAVETIRRDGAEYAVSTNRGLLRARSVVVCAGADSLPLAHRSGLALEYASLPTGGPVYYAPDVLSGKVYTLQDPDLPFAAIHGDRDIKLRGQTRFGPTGLALALLERRHPDAVRSLLKVLRFDRQAASALWDLLREPGVRGHVLRNFLSEIPGLNRRLAIGHIRKIVPALTPGDISCGSESGGGQGAGSGPSGVRPGEGALLVEETKVGDGAGLIFNLAPTADGTRCLHRGEQDMRALARHLGARIDEAAFASELLAGHQDLPGHPADGLPREAIPALAAAG